MFPLLTDFYVSFREHNTEKKNIWDNQEDYLGKIATVKYFEKTPKNIPRFPRLLGFRHPDDC